MAIESQAKVLDMEDSQHEAMNDAQLELVVVAQVGLDPDRPLVGPTVSSPVASKGGDEQTAGTPSLGVVRDSGSIGWKWPTDLWLLAIMGGFLAIICVSSSRFTIPQTGSDW